MKRITVLVIIFVVLAMIQNTYALEEIELNSNSESSIVLNRIKVENGEGFFKIKNSGNDNTLCFSYDGENYVDIYASDDDRKFTTFLYNCFDEITLMQAIKTEYGYVLRSTLYDNEYIYRYSEISDILPETICLIDNDLNYIGTYDIIYDGKKAIATFDMSYYDGMIYLQVTNSWIGKQSMGFANKISIVKSSDLINWIVVDTMPISGLSQTIDINIGEYNISGNTFTFDDSIIYHDEYKIVYEKIQLKKITNISGIFFAAVDIDDDTNYSYVAISNDGIYFIICKIEQPNLRFTNAIAMSENSYMLIFRSKQNGGLGLKRYININEIDSVIYTDSVYVRLNDTILGFSQPPVMEDDRTLVPMRFLFEQMGAEVDWNEATQTATATVPVSAEQQIATFGLETENSVTFSIDNLNATVNGELETMDVPARLINDQTFVPLRFLSENLGYNVEWDENTNTAIITTE